HVDEHMVLPRLLYISQSTEYGSLYSKDELRELSRYCRENELFLYMDGARLAVALTADDNDLSLSEIAGLVDAFYIGGTKNGALLGEAIVLVNPAIQRNFRFVMKQSGALLAKGRILGIQFAELFRDDLFFKLGQHANIRARQLAGGIRDAGFDFKTPPVTNQIFPILPDKLIEHLRKQFDFYEWETLEGDRSVIRLVTSWATQESAIEELIIEINGPNNVS
ncbi:MAG TPA: beta-eliminating lyase-related protein, partial [Membranihabitans sp.]|nr:beta-eliminating lyase-related protein [Membranihabitans sp.]